MPVETQELEWLKYYEEFSYFRSDLIREGCHPRILEHEGRVKNAVVLVHGLTDSPYYMMEIARFFHRQLGYNVYVPILQCHGLKVPMGMKGVDAKEWKKNVAYAIHTATQNASVVSIGGLSTGGTLSLHAAATNPAITGALYLFSAALDLAGGFWGQVKEKMLRSPVADLVDAVDKMKYLDKAERKRSLIGENPYRYNQMDKGGAKQLSLLIRDIDKLIDRQELGSLLSRPAFAAHSECDATTSIEGIEKLSTLYNPELFTFYRIAKENDVSHASLVLKYPVYAPGQDKNSEPLEKPNPLFNDMMNKVGAFAGQ